MFRFVHGLGHFRDSDGGIHMPDNLTPTAEMVEMSRFDFTETKL